MIARTIQAARASSSTGSIVLLVGFNLVPLAGILLAPNAWQVPTILVLYWIENGIVGVLNVPKMLLAAGPDTPAFPPVPAGAIGAVGAASAGPVVAPRSIPIARVGLVIFFLFHYGLFWLVHGVFVFALPTFAGMGGAGGLGGLGGTSGFSGAGDYQVLPDGTIQLIQTTLTGPNWSAVALGSIALAISRVASFFLNFVGRREYLHVTAARQMAAPYGRLVVLHLAILFGAFISIAIGSPVGAVVVLILLKTGLDLALHVRAHESVGQPMKAA